MKKEEEEKKKKKKKKKKRKKEEMKRKTYHIANISTLDEQPANKHPIGLNLARLPPIDGAVIPPKLVLQRLQPTHIALMNTHIRREDGSNEQLAQVFFPKGRRPVTPEDLRKGGAVEGFQDRTVIIQLGERRVQFDQKDIVDARVSDIVSNGRDQEG